MDLAVALDDALTRFAKPWNKLRAKRIYRDTDSQALTPNLLGAVQQAMDGSEFLILMASPESAQSNWVPAETAYWIGKQPLERLLIVVCAGEVVWDDAAGDFDWERTDCLPQSLKGTYEGQPLYLDLRWAREADKAALSLEDHRFKDAVARLSAALNGVSIEDMFSEEVRQFKRTTRIRNAAIAALSVLFVTASVAAVLAVQAREEAERQRDQAIKNSLRIEVRNDLDNNRLAHAVQLARVAREHFGADDPQIEDIGWEFVRSEGVVLREFPDLWWQFAQYSPDGSLLLAGFENEAFSLDIEVRDRDGKLLSRLDSVSGARFIEGGRKLLVMTPAAPLESTVEGIDADNTALRATCVNGGEFSMNINPGGLAFGLPPMEHVVRMRVWNPVTAAYEEPNAGDARHPAWEGTPVRVCGEYLRVFSPTGELQSVIPAPEAQKAVADPALERFAVQTPSGTVIVDGDGAVLGGVAGEDAVWSEDGAMFATTLYGETIDYTAFTGNAEYPFAHEHAAAAADADPTGPLGDQPEAVVEVIFAPGDGPNAQAGNGYTEVWSRDGEHLATLPGTHAFFALGGVITLGGFAVGDHLDRHPRLWSLERDATGRPALRLEMHGFHAVVSPDAQWIASGDEAGTTTWIWNRDGKLHAEVEGAYPVFHPTEPVLTTNLFGHVRDWYLPRLRSASGAVVTGVLGIDEDAWTRASLFYGDRECAFDCAPDDPWTVRLAEQENHKTTTTPGTFRGGDVYETRIGVSRHAGGGEPDAIPEPFLVRPCDILSDRYRDNLILLACASDGSWRVYDLSSGDIAPNGSEHEPLAWGVHGPGLREATFTPDGRRVLSIGVSDGRLWELGDDGRPAVEAETITLAFGAAPTRYDVSSDSSLLALVPANGAAQVWNLHGRMMSSIPPSTEGERFHDVGLFNGSRHLVLAGSVPGSDNVLYVPRVLDFDEFLGAFDWIADLPDTEYARLGLE